MRSSMITDEQLLNIFGPSPISRRRIRMLLGHPQKKVVSALIYSAVKRGILRVVEPEEVGYNGHRRPCYAVIHH